MLWIALLNALLTLSTFFTPPAAAFALFVVANGAAQAAAGGYFQTSLMAVASLFGPGAVQAMIAGQAAVAVVVSGVQVISAASSISGRPADYQGDGSAEEKAAFIFFGMSTVFLVMSYFAHEWMLRTPAYDRVAGHMEQDAQKYSRGPDAAASGRSMSRLRASSQEAANVIRVAKANASFEIAVASVFMITLSVFPPITISVSPANPDFHPLLFTAIHFLVFNTGDFLGRWACSFGVMIIWSAKVLLALGFSRILFIPLFLMCNVRRPGDAVAAGPAISSDLLFFFLMFAFGWSNGYVSSLCMMAAPNVEHNPRLRGRVEDVDVAGTVVSFALVGGLVLGSISSFAVRAAICGCNPFI